MSQHPEETTQTAATPGQLLREARIAKGLSQASVAKKICLSLQYIIDIESDDYSHFAAAIYTRGYLLSYARLVDVADETILNAYADIDLPQEEDTDLSYLHTQTGQILSRHSPIDFEQNSRARSRWVRWVGMGIGFLLVLMVILWWQSQKSHVSFSKAPSAPINTHDIKINRG